MRLLEASIIARGHQRWIETIVLKYHARLRILRSKGSSEQDEVLQLVEVIVDQGLKRKLVHELRSDPEISDLAITDSRQGRIIGLLRAKGLIMRCIADSDCFLIYASKDVGKEIEWRVLGTKKSLRRLTSRLTKRDIQFRIGQISEVKARRGLTPRQEWLLRSAYEKGYFSYPKGIHIRALAKLLGISAPTLFESLRKTQKKLLEEHFEGAHFFRDL